MLRLLHMVVLAALFLAAADVYKIKYESTLQAERVAKLRGEIRREQDTIANLRAEWSKLDSPDRIQDLARSDRGLVEHLSRARAKRFVNHVRHIRVGEHNDRRLAKLALRADFLQDIHPVHFRQHQIEQNCIGPKFVNPVKARLAILRDFQLVALFFKARPIDMRHNRIVFDDQYFLHTTAFILSGREQFGVFRQKLFDPDKFFVDRLHQRSRSAGVALQGRMLKLAQQRNQRHHTASGARSGGGN